MSEQSPVQPLAQRDKNRGHPHPPAKPILREEDRATPHTAKQLRERRRLIEMKIQEENVKLMQTFQTILSSEICIMIPAMAGIVNYERLDEQKQMFMGLAFLVVGFIALVSWIISYTTRVTEYLGVVSLLTCAVTLSAVGLFHFAVALLTPDDQVYISLNVLLLIFESVFILSMWNKHFPIHTRRQD